MLPLNVYVAAVLLFTHQGYSQKLNDSCVLEHTNTLGVCVQASSCQSARRDYQINGIKPTLCNSSVTNLKICCSDDSSTLYTAPDHKQSLVSSNNHQTTRNKKRLSERKCEEYSVFENVTFISLSKDPTPITISLPKCHYNGLELVLRGRNALRGEFPHMGAIGWVNFDGTYSFLCEGSLISTKFILTAAHCTERSNMRGHNPVIVRLGDQNLDPTTNDSASSIEVAIKSIKKHPRYISPGKYHDIALLELASDIDFGDAIRPACLWNRPDFPGYTKAVTSSWKVVDLQGDLCVKENDNSLGVCVPAARCESVKRDYLINRIMPTFCERNQQTVVVCCSDDNSIHFPSSLQTSSANNGRPQTQVNNNLRVSERKCTEYGNSVIEKIDGSDGATTANCDYNKVHLIVGGEDAERGEFPHMTAIGWINLQGTYSFLCGGSLISSKFVLTAAHCSKYGKMRDPKPVIVRLGDQNLNPEKYDGASPIDVKIRNIIKHPQYKSPGKYHDIALLELASNVEFQSSIRPACLWSKPGFSDYTQAVATGWGVVDPRTERTSDELKKVSLTLIENNYCDGLLKKKRNRNWAVGFTENQLCAGELRGGKDTCQGDSGSPLQVVSRENKCLFHLIGVTSFGDKCAQSGSPAVYTRVSSYLDWIESVVWPGES